MWPTPLLLLPSWEEGITMAVSSLTGLFRSLTLCSQVSSRCFSVRVWSHCFTVTSSSKYLLLFVCVCVSWQTAALSKLGTLVPSAVGQCRGFLTTASLEQNRTLWKQIDKYTTRPIGMKKTGGRDHTGKVLSHYNWNDWVWISIF